MAIKTSNQITFTEHKKIIEIKEWYLATANNKGVTIETPGWTTNIQTIDYTNKYLWNYEEVVYSIGSSEISEPVIIGFYGKGNDGKGISNIVNYYKITQNLVAPELPSSNGESSWSDISIISSLSPTNKYLWNYEAIIYTDGTITKTDPAIIGVYGDSGTNAVVFEIYSTHGFMFKEDLKSIELKVAAFEGGEAITNATYTWSWWDGRLNNGVGNYSTIKTTTNQTFTVNESDMYAFASLKCVMTYDGKTYEDYVVLTSETVICTSVVKFFDGSNIFNASEPFIVAYIELYKDQQEEELLKAPYYYYHEGNTYNAETDKYTFNSTGLDEKYKVNGTLVYMIYKVVNSTEDKSAKYKARLCQYNNGWASANATTYGNKYVYKNDLYNNLYEDIATNVVVISKEDVQKSKDINFTVYTKTLDSNGDYVYDDNLIIARSHVTVIDLNDPVISAIEPTNPKDGQLWLDTSKSPYVLNVYEDGEWVYFAQQNGKTVHTSKPSSYSIGDLWILASGETCGNFGEGTMLRAKQNSSTFNSSHWEDAMKTFTTLKTNIDQYFHFDVNNGLKIGQIDEAFYVNISSQKMSFYDNSEGKNKEVVYISNESANIDGLIVETSLDVNCNATFDKQVQFGNFVWKVESNGSLSLAIAN